MNVAIVYDRVNKWGGAERVLLTLHEMFPRAPLFTSIYNPKTAGWARVFPKIFTSFLQDIPLITKRHEYFPFLMPIAFENFNFDGYDLVISVTSEAAKGIITKPRTLHVCYCLTPTRYLWSHADIYFKNPFFKFVATPLVSYLRNWDRIAAQRPDVMVGISRAVQKRIKRYYKRNSSLIYPPVDLERFKIGKILGKNFSAAKKDKGAIGEAFYLFVGRLVPYKRVDLVIDAFNKLGYPLVVVGKGSEEKRLRSSAKENIRFVKDLSDEELAACYQKALALVFPGEEDFGLVVVESLASGTPVIAYKKGGALDIVEDGKTGVFFNSQKVEAIVEAVKRFESLSFKRKDLIESARRFSKERFKKEFLDLVNKKLYYKTE